MIALDTSEIFPYVFSTDRAKPEAERPTLLFHFPTCREVRSIANLFDAAAKASSVDESLRMRCDAVRVILCGWNNIVDRGGNSVPYDPAQLDAVLTDLDLTELDACLLRDMSTAELDKKKFALSAPSSGASFAAPVAAVPA